MSGYGRGYFFTFSGLNNKLYWRRVMFQSITAFVHCFWIVVNCRYLFQDDPSSVRKINEEIEFILLSVRSVCTGGVMSST